MTQTNSDETRILKLTQVGIVVRDVEKTAEEVNTEVTKSSSRRTVMDNIEFVDDSNTTGNEDGTAEHPYNTIQEGADAPRNTIYVFAGNYEGGATVSNAGATVMGQAIPVVGSTGKRFGGDAFPVVDGNVMGANRPGLRVTAHNVTVMGLEFMRTPGGLPVGVVDGCVGDVGLLLGLFPIGRGLLHPFAGEEGPEDEQSYCAEACYEAPVHGYPSFSTLAFSFPMSATPWPTT